MSAESAPNTHKGSSYCPFGKCDGGGFVVDEVTNTASDCSCRAQRIAMTRAVRLEGRIPNRYRGVSFDRPPVPGMPDDTVAPVRNYVRNLTANLQKGRGLWVVGDVGTGKTTLAMIISKAALDAGHSVAIYSLSRLLNMIRDEINGDSQLLNLLDRLSSVDLLHIDDLGAQYTTPWRLEQLYSIIDARYEANRSIIATTHLTPEKLSREMGQRSTTTTTSESQEKAQEKVIMSDEGSTLTGRRIVSRLVEMCGDPLTLFGVDRRQEFPMPPHGTPTPKTAFDPRAYSA